MTKFIIPFFLTLILCSAPAMAKEAQPGNIALVSILDADTSMEKNLLPDIDKFPELAALFDTGPLPAVSKTYFIIDGSHKILVDAGWGSEQKIKGQTLEQLAQLDVHPEDITDIFLTHLDSDHIGGLTRNGEAVFQNATLWIPRQEYEAWMKGDIQKRPEIAVERARKLEKIYENRIKLFDYDTPLLPGIAAFEANGHTPGHTGYAIETAGDRFLIVGDLIHIPQVQLVKPALSTIYDMNMEKAAQAREKILERATAEKATIGGMHFPMVGKVNQTQDGGFAIDK